MAGEFTGWKPSIVLNKQGGSRWSGKATIPNDGSKSQYQFKFVVNDKDWILNSALPTAKDSNGHPNNCLNVPNSGFGFQMNFSAPSKGPTSNEEKTFEDIRYARMKLNKVHIECTTLNAEIFLH